MSDDVEDATSAYGNIDHEGFYFLVTSDDPSRYGFVWRIWSGGTSFYVKPRSKGMGDFKISLHGADPREGLRPGFKIGHDHGAPEADYRVAAPGALPYWFPGWLVRDGLIKVVRVAVPADTFSHESARYGPPAGTVSTRMAAGYVDPPPAGSFAALDLYVSDQRPEWAGRAKAEHQRAIAGELRSKSGQYLIGLSAHISLADEPMPITLHAYDAEPGETNVTRGVATAVDGRGFVWLCERLMSETKLRDAMDAIASSEQRA